MIDLSRKEECYGCTACEQICPTKCIDLYQDNEGFLYPKVDKDRCIGCNLCNIVCPYLNKQSCNSVVEVYAAQNNDLSVRMESSSGGVFTLIADNVIENGGIVFGCEINSSNEVIHSHVDNKSDLMKYRNSKYVQSDVRKTYNEAKDFLDKGNIVLYSGTPCIIAGLKLFLKKEYSNLYTIDLLCHGVPSPKLYEEYVKMLEEKFHAKARSISFRNKRKSWKRLYTNIHFGNDREYFRFCGYDPYMSLFLNNKSQRPSCFECKFTCVKREGDVSLGDFWGISKHIPHLDDDKGTSLIIINNDKGNKMFNKIRGSILFEKSDIVTAKSGNSVLYEPIKKNKDRDKFYEVYIKSGIKTALKEFSETPNFLMKFYYNLGRKFLDFYRWMFSVKW